MWRGGSSRGESSKQVGAKTRVGAQEVRHRWEVKSPGGSEYGDG